MKRIKKTNAATKSDALSTRKYARANLITSVEVIIISRAMAAVGNEKGRRRQTRS